MLLRLRLVLFFRSHLHTLLDLYLLNVLMNMFYVKGGLLGKLVEQPNKLKRRLKGLRH